MADKSKPKLIVGTVPDDLPAQIAGLRSAVTDQEFAARLDKWFEKKMEERESRKQTQERKELLNIPTRKEIFGALAGIVKNIQERFIERTHLGKEVERNFKDAMARERFVTYEEALRIANEAVPPTLRNLDRTEVPRSGNQLLLLPAGSVAGGQDTAYWGTLPVSSGWNLSKADFGYKLNPDGDNAAEVQINGGTCFHIAVSLTKIVISGTKIVYIKLNGSGGSAYEGTIESGNSLPTSGGGYLYFGLYSFTTEGTPVAITDSKTIIYRAFDVEGGIDFLGAAAMPHAVWNPVTMVWEKGNVFPAGGQQYQTLQPQGTYQVQWDWDRWAEP